MKKRLIALTLFCLLFQGCAICLHYTNAKGAGGKADNVVTKVGKVDKAKADFNSQVDFWYFFPWKWKSMPELDTE